MDFETKRPSKSALAFSDGQIIGIGCGAAWVGAGLGAVAARLWLGNSETTITVNPAAAKKAAAAKKTAKKTAANKE